MKHTKGKLVRGCVVFMKESSGLTGYGNGQCVSDVCEKLGTVSLYGHNRHYKIYDIDRIVEYPIDKDSHDDLLVACERGLAYVNAIISKVPRPIQDLQEDKEQIEQAIAKAKK